MKEIVSRIKNTTKKQRIIAIAAVVIVAVGTATVIGVSKHKNNTEDRTDKNAFSLDVSALEASDNISSGGTISSAQLYDYLNLESTAVQLKVEEVYVESGDSITAGTQIYKLTEDSVAKAKTTLDKELKSAESKLLNQQLSYEETKNDAYSLYQSELLLGETAENEYNTGISQLDSELQASLDDYNKALDIVNNVPNQISEKKSETSRLNTEIADYEAALTTLQSDAQSRQTVYSQSADSYNVAVSEYNSIAGTVRYIGNYLGFDVSDIQLAQGPADYKEQENVGGNIPSNEEKPGFSGNMGGMDFSPLSVIETAEYTEPEETRMKSDAEDVMNNLYKNARAEYETQKALLSDAKAIYLTSKSEYENAKSAVSECSSNISNRKSLVSTLKSEISKLENNYSEAKSNLSTLKAEYNSLKLSYETDKLDLKKTYDTAISSFENAQYHYEITMSTVEEELAAAEEAVKVCEENLTVFEESLADGIIDAQQNGVVYSVTYEAEDTISVSSALIYYVDDTSFGTTVELDQYDVTKVSIGDSVIIYSSETGVTNGKITSISAGEAKTLASVKFNVTVVAEGESVNLYSGQSVNVYFNAAYMDASRFSDAENSGEKREEGDRGSFGGGMPDMEGFNPENMPDMNFGGGTPPQRSN